MFLELVYMRLFHGTLSVFATSDTLLAEIAAEIRRYDPLAQRQSDYMWRTDMSYDLLDTLTRFLFDHGFELMSVAETGAHYFRRYNAE